MNELINNKKEKIMEIYSVRGYNKDVYEITDDVVINKNGIDVVIKGNRKKFNDGEIFIAKKKSSKNIKDIEKWLKEDKQYHERLYLDDEIKLNK
jgi:hypothetical protein